MTDDECYNCYGYGYNTVVTREDGLTQETCPTCKGKGIIEKGYILPFNQAWAILKEEAQGPAPMPKESNWRRFGRGLKNIGRIAMNPKKNAPIVRNEEANHEANRQAEWDSRKEQQAAINAKRQADQKQAFKDWKDMPENDPKWNEFQRWQAQQNGQQAPAEEAPAEQPQQAQQPPAEQPQQAQQPQQTDLWSFPQNQPNTAEDNMRQGQIGDGNA